MKNASWAMGRHTGLSLCLRGFLLLFAGGTTAAWGQSYTYQLNDGFEAGALESPWGVELGAYDSSHVTVQTSPVRAGSYAVHLVNSYSDPDGSNQRTEMTAGTPGTLQWDKEYWIGFSFYLKDWAFSDYGEMTHQFHAAPNSAYPGNVAGRDLTDVSIQQGEMEFQTITFPKAGPAGGGAAGNAVWRAPVEPDVWYDWVLHIRPSQAATGFTEVYLNGRMIYRQSGANVDAEDSGGDASNPTHYLKCGVYNWPWEAGEYDVTRREVVYDQVKIGCVDDGYAGSYAGVAPAGSMPVTAPSAAPSHLTVTSSSSGHATLAWFDNSNNETGFKVERKVAGGTYAQVGLTSANVTTYTDSGLLPNTTYYYEVLAYVNGGAISYASPEANIRIESFGSSVADFTPVAGTWGTSSGAYVVTGCGTGTLIGSLSLLNAPVAGDFVLTANCQSVNSTSSWDNFNIVFNYQDASNYYYVNAVESANGSWNGLFKTVAGVSTRLTQWTAPFASGTSYAMTVQRIGDSILVYRDGVLAASVLDPTFRAGQIGFGTSEPTAGPKLAQFSGVVLAQSELTDVPANSEAGPADFAVAQGEWDIDDTGFEVTALGSNARMAALILYTTPIAGDFTVKANAEILSEPSSWNDMNIVFNYQDINDYYYVNVAQSANGAWDGIFRVQGGTVTALANWTTAFTPGTTYALEVQKVGSVISAYSNGTLLGSATDSTFTGGRIGLGTSETTTGPKLARFENVVVTSP